MTPEALRAWVAEAPPGALIPASAVADALARPDVAPPVAGVTPAPEMVSWRERLWTAPADQRLGIRELCEALDRPASWVYRHTSPKSNLPRLPHRKLENELVFVVGEIRAWIERNEVTVIAAPFQLLNRRMAR